MRLTRGLSILAAVLLLAACGGGGEETDAANDGGEDPMAAGGTIIRMDPALDALLPADAVVEKVADGFIFTEGPVWVPGDPDRLYFSDIPANTVYRWSEAEGSVVFLQPVLPDDAETGGTGGSNGLALHPDGRLILCEHGGRRVAAMNPAGGDRVTLADRYDGKRLNSPNDIVFHTSGAAFFTDPPYGLAGQDDSEDKEQEHNGIYRLDPDGTVTLLETGQTRPNGLGLSPDETTLYVANSDAAPNRYWKKYAVLPDLTLGEGEMFFDGSAMEAPGAPDGLAVDTNGNVWATGPGGVLVLDPDGRHLGTVAPAELPANAGFGGDGSVLYMTARSGLYRVATNARGLVYAGGD